MIKVLSQNIMHEIVALLSVSAFVGVVLLYAGIIGGTAP